MDTSPNPTSDADTKPTLNEMIIYQLFESTSWPIADDKVRTFWRTVEEMGLRETVPGTKNSFDTSLGIDCGVELASCFIGAHEPFEIPMILKEHGLIDDAEEKAFHSFLSEELADDGLLLKHVEVLVRRAHARLFRVKDKLKLQSAQDFNAERLEKYGIKVEVSDDTIAMWGRNGALFAQPEGESIHCERKLGVDTEEVLEAIQGVEIVDENDHRFLGFSPEEAMLGSVGLVIGSSNRPADQCVLIEGPLSHDVDFAIMWLKAARKADLRWDRLTWNNPQADELWEKLCSYNPMYETLDHRPDLDFGTAALSFVGEWLTNASFALNVSSSRWSEHFSLMLFAGLFVQTGGRYQMAIPDEIDIRKICDRLADWLKRMDQEKLSPNGLFVTLSERDAKS